MNDESLILVVRVIAIAVVALIIVLVAFGVWRNRQQERTDIEHPKSRRSALDDKSPLQPDEADDFASGNVEVRHRTTQLNPSFFGNEDHDHPKKPRKQANNVPIKGSKPTMDLPYTIMARFGRHLSGDDVANLVRSFGLQRAPSGAYELIGEDGEEVVFTMLNVRKPGIFPEDLATLKQLEGLMLIMQLPVGDDSVKSWETFTAIAHEMSEKIDARLCDHARRPIGDYDLMKYRQAAEQFEEEYNLWRQQR